ARTIPESRRNPSGCLVVRGRPGGRSWLGGAVSLEIWMPPQGSKRFHAQRWNLFSRKISCRLLQDWVLGPGFGALKYDVRHTPIVIERTAKEWKLKRT